MGNAHDAVNFRLHLLSGATGVMMTKDALAHFQPRNSTDATLCRHLG